MNTHWKLGALTTLGALALFTSPANAQVEGQGQELGFYGGQLFGDDLTNTPVSGQTPKLDDDVTYGVRYGYNFSTPLGTGDLGRRNAYRRDPARGP